jgi:hypothetical protein
MKWVALTCAAALVLPASAVAGSPVREHPGADKQQSANHGDCKNPGPKGDWANEPGQPKTTGWHNGYDCGPALPPPVVVPPKPTKPPVVVPPKVCPPPPPPACHCPTTPPVVVTPPAPPVVVVTPPAPPVVVVTPPATVTNTTYVTIVKPSAKKHRAKPHRHHAKPRHHKRVVVVIRHRAPQFAG